MGKTPTSISLRVLSPGIPKPEADEEILFSSSTIVVTDRRILFKTRSYAISGVSSVKVHDESDGAGRRSKIASSTYAGVAVILLGIGLAAAGIVFGGDLPFVLLVLVAISVVIVVIGVLIITTGSKLASPGVNKSAPYAVRIYTLDGQKERISGLTEQNAHALAGAISHATAKH